MKFFYDNFDLLIDEAGSVDAFKKLILEMAVRGMLVPQDPNDEPASVLIEKLTEERERLINEGILKKEKPLPPIKEEEVPFDLPEGWEWVRLGTISIYIQRGKSPIYSEVKMIPVVAQKCIQWSGFDISRAKFIDPDTIDKYLGERFLEPLDLLWNSTGVGTLGRINIYEGDTNYDKVVADSHVTVIRPAKSFIDSRFLFSWFSSPEVQNEINNKASGSTKQTELATSTIKEHIVPLPPLNEQKRIVKKIDEIFEMIPQLEEAFEKRTNYNRQLNRTSLNRLTEAKSRDDFVSSMQFVTNKFDSLYDNIENIKELRQAILTLAVQGKLVPQDPNDEPASVLLEKIQKEKERLINEGLLIKEKLIPPIKQNEVPFILPDGWEWVRFDTIVMPTKNSIRRGPFGSSIRKDMFVPKSADSYKVYEQKNAIQKDHSLGSYYITKDKYKELRNFVAKAGDIIISCAGTIGEAYLLPNEASEGVINQALLKITLNNKIIIDSYFLYLFANLTRVNINQDAKGSAMKNIMSIDVLKKIMLPLPPYQEQKRIVANIKKLMAFCDDLENCLYKCEHISEQLLTVVLYEAI